MSPAPPRRPVRLIATLIVAIGVALAGWLLLSVRWKSKALTITELRGEYDDSKLELCGAGHFDQQGPLGEVLYRLGMGPTDNEASHCVTITFTRPLAPGAFRIRGDGRYGADDRAPPFWPGPEHAPEVKSVVLTLSCFCGEFDQRATFEGVLKLDDVSPPRGRLELTVESAGEQVLEVDSSLRRFTWSDAKRGY